ncbi:GvpL/GvpF family gas vesicle protein [Halogeometricum sp. S1BR25-6]|uniref:GvpL/GvpF family gas vesicle protein n=1 Tax=Halogeometricum salsisoli TaxID=2950536 RepID=A0ABU2GC20_9EURY|nr:GvpL/GvpF family gas vesicle protein [Halogeometricum sp. S1BR25-6]MDS0298350.1 GvpL/GvpF family gas vesicle protein [Halogeometricum sp. S1BR25-6]
MSDADGAPGADDDAADGADEDGRYLYCVVRRDDDAAARLDAAGVGGASLSVVSTERLSAIVHERSDPYESDAPDEVREWLYDHQDAVEDVGEAFGTPVPFRFDTIVRGGDETIREWLAANEETLADALDSLAGRWEYRVEVEWDREALAERVGSDDERLAELGEKLSDASEGTAFLVQKQYDKRLSTLVNRRRRARSEELVAELESMTDEVRELGDAPQTPLTEAPTGPTARFAVLADEGECDAVGEYLDTVADEDGASVRFTGPWPPYTFAPDALEPADSEGGTERKDAETGTEREENGTGPAE